MVLLLNLIATWFMVGLIWMVQLVHYRQFDLVGEAGWTEYHRGHSRRITWIVAPMMLAEALTAVWLVVITPTPLIWIAAALVGVVWASTAVLQVPMHHRLATRFDADQCRKLTAGNWVRTIAWTARGLIMAYVTSRAMA